jgi:peptidyl-prolyl cis-trans isomerase SurA
MISDPGTFSQYLQWVETMDAIKRKYRISNKECRMLKLARRGITSSFEIPYSIFDICSERMAGLLSSNCQPQKNWLNALIRLVFGILVLGVCGALPVRGETIDRLIVAVNGKVITEGDLDLARKLNSVVLPDIDAKPRSRKEEIDRLIDLELMRQELKNFSLTQEDETKIAARMQSLQAAYAEKGGLPVLLRNLGLQETELLSYVRLESSILRFVDFRFRPFVNVTEVEIKDYYETRLIPQLRESKLAVPELAQVSAKIEEILKEEKINGALEQWISTIKRNARIEYFLKPSIMRQGGSGDA